MIEADHALALEWFSKRTGTVVPWPKPLEGSGLFLANKAKGIHKPSGWAHALSIRIIPGGRYPDEEPQRTTGVWRFRYHQEEPTGVAPSTHFTNRSLQKCLEDAVPIGVMSRVENGLYEIIGLGLVTDWSEGYFTIEGPVSMAGAEGSLNEGGFDPTLWPDSRERVFASIVRRRGQPTFRAALIASYSGRCAFSGCNVLDVLEAAHIAPYGGAQTNDPSNGFLLRADLHTLFDLGLIQVNPSTFSIEIADSLLSSTYGKLHGRSVRLPPREGLRPSRAALTARYIKAESTSGIEPPN